MTDSAETQTNAARTRELNDTIRYTMWSVFRLRDVLGDVREARTRARGQAGWVMDVYLLRAPEGDA